MTDYTALVSKWATLTPGTTAVKLAQLSAITVTGTVPTSFFITGAQLLNCVNWTEFAALTATQQSQLLSLCTVPGSLLGGSGNTSFIVDGMVLAFFTNHAGPTVAALTALAQGTVVPWWQASVANGGGGLTGPVTNADLIAAGNLT